jgi:hypothetical protein
LPQADLPGFPATLPWKEPRAVISCTLAYETATCAAFIEESRMESISANNFTGNPGCPFREERRMKSGNATKLYRKSGIGDLLLKG